MFDTINQDYDSIIDMIRKGQAQNSERQTKILSARTKVARQLIDVLEARSNGGKAKSLGYEDQVHQKKNGKRRC